MPGTQPPARRPRRTGPTRDQAAVITALQAELAALAQQVDCLPDLQATLARLDARVQSLSDWHAEQAVEDHARRDQAQKDTIRRELLAEQAEARRRRAAYWRRVIRSLYAVVAVIVAGVILDNLQRSQQGLQLTPLELVVTAIAIFLAISLALF